MKFKGSVTISGDASAALSVSCVVESGRLMMTAAGGEIIGDWPIESVQSSLTPSGVSLVVDGEHLVFATKDAEAFLGAVQPSPSVIASRVKDATAKANSDRISPLIAVGVIAGVLLLFAAGLWLFDAPPFDGGDEPAIAAPTSTTLPSTTTTTLQRARFVTFEVAVYDDFDWVEDENYEGDSCVAIDWAYFTNAGAIVVVREASTQEIVTTGSLGPGELSIEPGMGHLPDDELDLFWNCLFTTRLDASSLTTHAVYEVGIEDNRYTATGADLLADYGAINLFQVDIEAERQLIRIGG
jgi:hypothetical protein